MAAHCVYITNNNNLGECKPSGCTMRNISSSSCSGSSSSSSSVSSSSGRRSVMRFMTIVAIPALLVLLLVVLLLCCSFTVSLGTTTDAAVTDGSNGQPYSIPLTSSSQHHHHHHHHHQTPSHNHVSVDDSPQPNRSLGYKDKLEPSVSLSYQLNKDQQNKAQQNNGSSTNGKSHRHHHQAVKPSQSDEPNKEGYFLVHYYHRLLQQLRSTVAPFIWFVSRPSIEDFAKLRSSIPSMAQLDEDAAMVAPIVKRLKSKTFFKIFNVDLLRPCPFWAAEAMCSNKDSCSVCQCTEDDIPKPWKMKPIEEFVDRKSSSSPSS
eukprot:GHVQ01031589.1.p1 GENE.GHVQ01031589.1~~GHVQ01031589.1.p1  ORF type:complete len:318 (+),score=79.24 GHVQ01031589.1:428-1381(+)